MSKLGEEIIEGLKGIQPQERDWVACGHRALGVCRQCFDDQAVQLRISSRLFGELAAELAALKAQRDRLLAKLNRLEVKLNAAGLSRQPGGCGVAQR